MTPDAGAAHGNDDISSAVRRIYAIVFSHACNQALFGGTRFLASLYAVNLGASPLVLGVIVALFSLGPALFTVLVGRLIDRIGTQRPLAVSLAVMTGITLLPFIWPGLWALFLAAPVIGVVFFAIYLAISTLLNHHSTPASRAPNFSRLSVGVAVAQGLGPLTGGVCADHLGYGPAFAVMALFPMAGYLVFRVIGRVGHVPAAAKPGQTRQSHGSLFDLLRDRELRSVYMFSTMFILAWDIFIVMLPLYGTQLGFSASQLGLVMTAYAVASFVVRVAAAWLSKHYSAWQLMYMALAIASVSTVIFGFMTSLPLLMTMAFFMGLGQGLGAPMMSAAMYEVAPRERVSEATGLRMSLGMSAQTVLPLAVGSIGSLFAASHIFAVSGLLLAIGLYTERRQWRRRKSAGLGI